MTSAQMNATITLDGCTANFESYTYIVYVESDAPRAPHDLLRTWISERRTQIFQWTKEAEERQWLCMVQSRPLLVERQRSRRQPPFRKQFKNRAARRETQFRVREK